MNVRFVCAVVAVLLSFTPSVRGGFLDVLLGKHQLEVISVTDMTPEGRLRPAPTPDHPVYYVALSLGYHDLGAAIGGEKIPPKDEVIRNISAVLAKQGFLPATASTPAPTIALAFVWGTLNADYFYGPDPDLPRQQLNRQQILKFLGGYKVGFSDRDFDPLMPPVVGLNMINFDARAFYDAASDDYYVAGVAAYDLAALRKREKKMLWMTRISCPSRGFALPEVLPAMLAIGGPNLGRETARPVWFRASDKYRTDVKLGELKLLESLGSDPLPVVEPPPAQKR